MICCRWPNSIILNNSYLIVFSGELDEHNITNNNNTNNIIEKINIVQDNSLWEIVSFKYEGNIPIFSGIIPQKDNTFILVGGKLQNEGDNLSSCLLINIDNMTVNKNNINLPSGDEFDGKTFYNINEGKYGMFSALDSKKFYIFNESNLSFEIVELD